MSEPAPTDLRSALAEQFPALAGRLEVGDADLPRRLVEALGILLPLLNRLSNTLLSELEVLGKSHPQIKALHATLVQQDLLAFEGAVHKLLQDREAKTTRLRNGTDLLARWWTAIITGVQSTILDVPGALTDALNPAQWAVEKKRWGSEEAAYWEHFRFVIRGELPLRFGDELKHTQGVKTLEAYTVLGGAPRERGA